MKARWHNLPYGEAEDIVRQVYNVGGRYSLTNHGDGTYSISAEYPDILHQSLTGGVIRVITTTSTAPAKKPKPEKIEKVGQVIEAYRRWYFYYVYPGGFRLSSEVYQDGWPPYKAVEAHCKNEAAPKDHPAPVKGCSCGIYARKKEIAISWDDMMTMYVVGSVYLWGKVIEHEDGYRAQFAYPKELVVLSGGQGVADALKRAYGVPVDVAL